MSMGIFEQWRHSRGRTDLWLSVTTTPANAEAHLPLPSTPKISILGKTIYSATKWMLSVEGRKVIPPSTMADFSRAMAILFSSYMCSTWNTR
ncbi:hypothetical protein SKAU_G00282430 [Synaphobranchus kaupii]|uniref:Uncharacterized protein n=1 Tax=Synaphobranchus kaupii TaxID=118154 RepID=A0A9Q1EXG7_SYNKA|nr:hypothetical protein SKAU_G00282430 [Synaphobranchus kaupii]